MSANAFGIGTFGCVDESLKGFYAENQRLSCAVEDAWAPNHIAEEAGLTLFNEKADFEQSGLLVTANTTAQTLGAALDVAATAMWGTDSGVTAFFVLTLDLERRARDYYMGTVRSTGRAALTDTTPTVIS